MTRREDRAWRIGQTSTVMSTSAGPVPGTIDERVEEIVAGKRRVAGMVLPARSEPRRSRSRPAAGGWRSGCASISWSRTSRPQRTPARRRRHDAHREAAMSKRRLRRQAGRRIAEQRFWDGPSSPQALGRGLAVRGLAAQGSGAPSDAAAAASGPRPPERRQRFDGPGSPVRGLRPGRTDTAHLRPGGGSALAWSHPHLPLTDRWPSAT